METSNVIGALAALAQETRLAVYRLLVEHAPEGLPAGQIAERLGIPPPSLSFHLKELSRAGLIAASSGSPQRGEGEGMRSFMIGAPGGMQEQRGSGSARSHQGDPGGRHRPPPLLPGVRTRAI